MLGRSFKTILCVVAISAIGRHMPSHHAAAKPPGLTVREEGSRVVFTWNGPIVAPMRDQFAAALAKYSADQRPFLVTLDSPGGSVAEGHGVMAAVRAAAEWHRVDTRVERGAICASMCVPLFLLGSERTADPEARFMFHEVKLVLAKKAEGQQLSFADARSRKAVETLVTDQFYEADVGGTRVSPSWLRRMRVKIVGHDIWASAGDLVSERSGVVDALVPTGAS